MNLSPDNTEALVRAMADWYGMAVSPELVGKVAGTHPGFVCDTEACGVDTVAREWFADLLGRHLGMTGRWPLGMDTKEYTASYFAAFKEKAIAAGITLREGWMEGT